jgi:hypothetical protein
MVLGCSLGLHRLKRGGARLVLALASLLVEGEALEHAVYGVVELRQTLEGRSGGRVEQSPYVRQQRLCLVEEGAQQQRAARLERVAAMHRRACARLERLAPLGCTPRAKRHVPSVAPVAVRPLARRHVPAREED